MVKLMLPNNINWRTLANAVMFTIGLGGASLCIAAPVSDIRKTLHNLSVNGPGTVKATTETQVCVFCHTPHNANATAQGPLWNKAASSQTYTRFTSNSLDANNIADGFKDQPGGSSLLCLSCHDGTVALGEIKVAPKNTGTTGTSIAMNAATDAGKMPVGLGENTGFTRRLGTDLTNDHPISITYNDLLAGTDGELARLNSAQGDIGTSGALIGIRSSGYKPLLPLERTGAVGGDGLKAGQVQCATCHDPHLYDAADPRRKFLRLNRLQANNSPTSDVFVNANDNICLACHRKSYSSWGMSAHAKTTTANETYTDAAADLRGFPRNTTVWQAACLNCHDTHTVQGSRRLLREGVGSDLTKSTLAADGESGRYQMGSAPVADNSTKSSLESTCFQCHRASGGLNILNPSIDGSMVPAVKSLFDLPYGMPVATPDQPTTTREVHNVTNGNMREDPANLGQGGFATGNANRHAECTDCHNPHRVRRSRTFYSTADADNTTRTHIPGGAEGNIASGVLRGTWGVEPTFGYSETSWPTFPTFNALSIKEGDPGIVGAPAGSAGTRAAGHLTREYQLCFKCHSNYANGETAASFPSIVADYAPLSTRRRTPTSDANGLTRYTNVAAEFGSVMATDPATSGTDQGEFGAGTFTPRTALDRVGTSSYTSNTNNHRSWHPVLFPTGRTRAARRMSASGERINLLPPFKAAIGAQTMHCSDCHGQAKSWIPGKDNTDGSDVEGGADPAQVQGPHGSENPFLLRGAWNDAVSLSNVRTRSYQTDYTRPLCGNCHQPRDGRGGFGSHLPDGDMSGMKCMDCHIALPHGWRNKAFLVNLRCVGTEVGRGHSNWSSTEKSAPTDCDDFGNYSTRLNEEPYYYRSSLRVTSWARSGSWSDSNCGGGSMTDGSC